MKDILPPHLKYNVIVTEFTNHWRKEQIYHPQDGAKIKISRRKWISPTEKEGKHKAG